MPSSFAQNPNMVGSALGHMPAVHKDIDRVTFAYVSLMC